MRTYIQETRVIDKYNGIEISYQLKDNPTYNEEIDQKYGDEKELDKNKFAVYKNNILVGKRKTLKEARELYKSIYPKNSDEENELDKRLHLTEFFVKATSKERHGFWRTNKDDLNTKSEYALDWVDDSSGVMYQVGSVKVKKEKLPVCVTFSFAKLNGVQVCFYTSDSRCVDWVQIRDFIQKYFPTKYDNGTRTARTDSSNFHHCSGYCHDRKKNLKHQSV